MRTSLRVRTLFPRSLHSGRKHFLPTRPHRLLAWVLAIQLIGFAIPTTALACSWERMMQLFNDAKARGDVAAMCRIVKAIDRKFHGGASCPTPQLPTGVTCPPAGGGGDGRGGTGGGGGGGGGGAGGGVPFNAVMRNHAGTMCPVTWTVTPDPGNPPGFVVAPSSGMTPVPAGMTALAPFAVTISPGVPAGTVAHFSIAFVDGCTGMPYPDDFSTFDVVRTPAIEITTLAPVVFVPPGPGGFSVTWHVKNASAVPVTKPYTFGTVGDPESMPMLNNGTPYFVPNAFPANKAVTGGSVSMPAGGEADIIWDLLPGQYCDPEMMGCCVLHIDGASSCIMTPNSDTGPHWVQPGLTELVGTAQGGQLFIQINGPGHPPFFINAQTMPGDQIPNILDRIAQQMLSRMQFENLFNYPPEVTPTSMAIMRPQSDAILFQSQDPGLAWVQHVSGVEERAPAAISVSPLENPARATVTFSLALPTAGPTKLSILDVAGRRVAKVLDGRADAGASRVTWSGRRDDGGEARPGVYLYSLVQGGRRATGTVILMR